MTARNRWVPAHRALAVVLLLAVAAAGCGNQGSTPGPSSAAVGPIGAGLQAEFEEIVDRVAPSVVLIQTSDGLGSGVVYDTKGHIVTNAHVVGDETQFMVSASDGRQRTATLVGSFPVDDLAVIRAEGTNLPPATFGDSSQLDVGTVVLAIGNPLGLQSSVTEGIISATGRTVVEPGGAALPNTLQTSAAINPGNSGGALVDLTGAVIGIPTLAARDPGMGGAAPGIGFAIPSNTAKEIARQFVENGKVVSSHRAYLGIQSAAVRGVRGVLVYSVDERGPAAKAGIKPGELIVEIDGKPTPDPAALAAVLAELRPGQTVKVVLLKSDGSTREVSVTLGELPSA
ncbi:MAG TPA: trypsin-like peptidase domain-containing protein [Candidatus Limnocylindrales bacterium]|nr:trypsin-like peptidase domain-containing protein [Candidatus Limnocylindrales bacterium]